MKTVGLIFLLLATALPTTAMAASAEATASVAEPWEAIKYCTYEKRAEFTAGTGRLVKTVDDQIRELNEKRVTLPETSIKDWDFAMKALVAARSYLVFTVSTVGEATSETWGQTKDRVGRAWQDTQDAYGKVKASTTS